jgi:hypothetical protein
MLAQAGPPARAARTDAVSADAAGKWYVLVEPRPFTAADFG